MREGERAVRLEGGTPLPPTGQGPSRTPLIGRTAPLVAAVQLRPAPSTGPDPAPSLPSLPPLSLSSAAVTHPHPHPHPDLLNTLISGPPGQPSSIDVPSRGRATALRVLPPPPYPRHRRHAGLREVLLASGQCEVKRRLECDSLCAPGYRTSWLLGSCWAGSPCVLALGFSCRRAAYSFEVWVLVVPDGIFFGMAPCVVHGMPLG